jgi:DNA polymerase-3 subunit delta'
MVMSEAEAVRRGRAEPDGKRRPSQDILVDALRDLSVRLRMTAYQGGYRVAVVIDAHRMNVNAQNALLKTLEEPGERTVVILLAPHERAVLPTIASRCLRLSFQPLAERDLRAVLDGLGTPDAELRARRARGSVARALALDLSAGGDGDAVQALWDALLGEGGDAGPLAASLDAAEAVGKERSDVEQALTRLEQRLADAARAGAAGSETPSWRQASALLERVGRARTAIAHNASVQLALEELLFGRGLAARPATR